MKSEHTAKNIARIVALGALFLIPFTPLIVADHFFFPFITGKAFFFRILVEIAVSAFVVLAVLDKEYRPRFSWIGVSVVAFVAWMAIADAFAPNAFKAFWSNFERMEGWVLLVHLLGFFFVASTVLRAEKKWRAWFLTSLGVSVIVAGYALLQIQGVLAIHQGSSRIDASLGNSAYLAIYFLFNVCIAAWLALTEKLSWLKWSLLGLAVLEAVLIFFTETRGTILGLVGAATLAALLTVFTAGKRVRTFATAALLLIVILVGGVYFARDSSFIQDNSALRRVTSISLADGETRFTIWHMAAQGVVERPVVGWGQEGFNYVFNKYYDPSLYAQEPWFDRAHNAFIDWLTAGGVPAFLLYLSLFGTAIVMLWRSSELSRPERIALTAALVGYAVHNMFVFDNLYSYIYFFAVLALIDSQIAQPCTSLENLPVLGETEGLTYVLPVAAVGAFVCIWFVNISGMQVATKLITAISPAENVATNIAAFEDLVTNYWYAKQEVREQLVTFAASAVRSSQVSDTDKQKVFTLAIAEIQKEIAAHPFDAREYLQLSYVYRAAGANAEALQATQKALELSPKKEMILIEEGITEWDLGNVEAVQKAFSAAYALGPQFTALAEYAAAGNIAAKDSAAADAILIAAYGSTIVDSDVLAVAYYRTKNWPRLIALWKLRASVPNASAQTMFSLASAYYISGDSVNAIATIKTAVAKFPEAAESAAAAIAQIEGKSTK